MNITVLGAGSFGAALAGVLLESKQKPNLTLWARRQETLDNLPCRIGQKVSCAINLEEGLKKADGLIYALPAQAAGVFFEKNGALLKKVPHILIAAKGVDKETALFPFEAAKKAFPEANVTNFSGPHLAPELLEGSPTLALLAGTEAGTAFWSGLFSGTPLVTSCVEDPITAATFGAFKNIFAILSGALMAQNAPENTRNAILALAFNETCLIAKYLGGAPIDAVPPALVADFFLTTNAKESRNTKAGVALIKKPGAPLPFLAEGVDAAIGASVRLGNAAGQFPLFKCVRKFIQEGRAPYALQLLENYDAAKNKQVPKR